MGKLRVNVSPAKLEVNGELIKNAKRITPLTIFLLT